MPNNYILTSNGSFISKNDVVHGHNICYIDLEQNELIHWKYIKREKLSNGKYRYYYDESDLKTQENYVKAVRNIAMEKGARAAADNVNFQNMARSNKYSTAQKYKAATKAIDSYNNAKFYDNLADRAVREYEIRKLTSFPARVISKGYATVANWLSGSGNKKKKKK